MMLRKIFRERAWIPIFSLLIIIGSSAIIQASSHGENYLLFEYGSSECPHCIPQHNFLLYYYGSEHHVFCDISTNKTCMLYFAKYIKATGLPAAVPQTLVFIDGHLSAIVIGEVDDRGFWDRLIGSKPSYEVSLYSGERLEGVINLSRGKLIAFINELIPEPYSRTLLKELNESAITTTSSRLVSTHTQAPRTGGGGAGLRGVIPALIPLALADSVNPCTFTLYVAILIAASAAAGRRGILASGTSFIVAVYLGYMSLGIILSYGASLLPKSVMVIFAGAYGAFIIIYSSIKHGGGRSCKAGESCRGSELFSRFNRRVGVLGSLVMGLLASYTLLPCSGGPYLAFAAMVSLASLWERLTLLLVYNAIFILPLALILAGTAGFLRLGNVERGLVRYERPLLIFSGITLILVSIYLYLTA